MQTKPKLSLVINTLNEEKNIRDCILSARDFCSEIIVVDMFSDDQTRQIANEAGATVYTFERTGYVEPARNYAISKAKGDWILILDADERLKTSNPLILKETLLNSRGVDAFNLTRRNQIFNRWIQGTGWGPEFEQHIRLFKKGSVTWNNEIHSVPKIDGIMGHFEDPFSVYLDHYNYKTIEEFITRLNRYTTQEAIELSSKSIKWDMQSMFNIPLNEFKKRFEPEIDDSHSAVLSGFMAAYKFIVWAKLWEIEKYPKLPDPKNYPEMLLHTSVADKTDLFAKRINVVSSGNEQTLLGFYQDEGGWRWSSPLANINIPTGNPCKISFALSAVDENKYFNFPFKTEILINNVPFTSFEFEKPWEKKFFEFQTPKDDFLNVRIRSQGELKNENDERRLSLIFSDYKVTSGKQN